MNSKDSHILQLCCSSIALFISELSFKTQ